MVHSEKTSTGTAIILKWTILKIRLCLLGELSLPAFDNKTRLCGNADLLKLGYKMSLFGHHKVKIEKLHQFQNNYHATYAVGKLTDLTLKQELHGQN